MTLDWANVRPGLGLDVSRFSPIAIGRLPFPAILATVDFEAILREFKSKAVDFTRPDLKDAVKGVLDASIEGDPIVALLETFAYFYMTKVAEENDKAKALMLPYAYGTTLDVLAYNLFGTSRRDGETDEELRARAILSWEALSTAGPYGAYTFHSLSAHPKVKGVNVIGPESGLVDPGQVKVVVLSKEADGVPSPGVVEAVRQYLNATERRPLTDQVLVEACGSKSYSVEATLIVLPGPDAGVIRAAALARLQAYTADRQRIGAPVPLSGLHAALTVEGVEQVNLASPLADVVPAATEAPFCTGITLWTDEAVL